MQADGTPVPGVLVSVTSEAGFNSSGSSDDQGQWVVAVPEAGAVHGVPGHRDAAGGPRAARPGAQPTHAQLLLTLSKTVQFPLGEEAGGGSQWPSRALQLFVDGLAFGLILALAGVGLSLVFGTTGLTNFAHGDLMTFGALAALVFNNYIGLPLVRGGRPRAGAVGGLRLGPGPRSLAAPAPTRARA